MWGSIRIRKVFFTLIGHLNIAPRKTCWAALNSGGPPYLKILKRFYSLVKSGLNICKVCFSSNKKIFKHDEFIKLYQVLIIQV